MEMDIVLQVDKWAKIHFDVLDEIIKRVHSYGDYVRFRAACKSWNLQLQNVPKHIKIPLLVLPFDDESDTVRSIYHVGEKKVTHRLELPETKNTMFCGSSYGWLITIGLDGELQMLEPLTRVQIDLPPLSTFPTVVNYQADRKEYTIKRRNGKINIVDKFYMQKDYVYKIILSSPPDDYDQDFMAIAFYGNLGELAYCARGDKKWKDFTTLDVEPTIYHDAIFQEGKIYAIDFHGWIYEYDMKTRVGRMSGAPQYEFYSTYREPDCRYLVGTSDGLLSVERHVDGFSEEYLHNGKILSKYMYYTREFRVYKLSQSKWTQVKSLGDYAIAIGHNSSACYAVPHDKRNQIYYSDDIHELQNNKNFVGGHDIGIFYLEDGSFHRLFPDADIIFPTPIWLL